MAIKVRSEGRFTIIEVSWTGLFVQLTNHGAAVLTVAVPDRSGNLDNIVLSGGSLQRRLQERLFLGSSVGRCAGRIKDGRWYFQGQEWQLEQNEGKNHLHGGTQGFDTIFWQWQVIEIDFGVQVVFRHHFNAMVAGYPGQLAMMIRYTIMPTGRIAIEYFGETDETTLLNPTNHTYFNLSGSLTTIADHQLQICSDSYVPLRKDKTYLSSKQVAGTIFDLRAPQLLAEILRAADPQIIQENGLNHPFLLGKGETSAELYHPMSGRKLQLSTSCDALVCYTGNHFAGTDLLKHGGIALEAQSILDVSPEQAYVLTKNRPFYSKTCWCFSVGKS